MKVKDAMSTDLIVGYVPGTVHDVLKTLAKHNVSGMPILKKDTKKVVGVVTRSDIFRNADEDQIALIMSQNPEKVNQDQNLEDAAQIFLERRIHGIPVVDSNDNIVGIISPADVLRALPNEYDDVVENYLTQNLVPVFMENPITIVMEIINVTNETALPVLNTERKLAGIVSEGDLFKLSHIKESISRTDMGMGGDEDEWTWEGIRDTVRLYYATTQVDLPTVPVSQVMITNVIKAFRNTPISDIARKMYKNRISHVPVVNEEDRLIGMVSDIDLMACMFQKC